MIIARYIVMSACVFGATGCLFAVSYTFQNTTPYDVEVDVAYKKGNHQKVALASRETKTVAVEEGVGSISGDVIKYQMVTITVPDDYERLHRAPGDVGATERRERQEIRSQIKDKPRTPRGDGSWKITENVIHDKRVKSLIKSIEYRFESRK